MALDDDLVAYWPMDEASGNIIDAHSTFDLTETSGTIGTGSGIIGNARDFEAADTEYAAHADGSPFDLGDTDWSFAGWVKFESLDESLRIFSKDGANSFVDRSYGLYSNAVSGGKLVFHADNDGSGEGDTAQWGSNPSTATWYFVACGHSATANEIWISVDAGTPVTTSHSTGVFNGTAEFRFGNRGDNSLHFDGLSQFWGLWGRDIRADLTDLYNGGTPLTYDDLTGGGGAAGHPAAKRMGGVTFSKGRMQASVGRMW